MSGPPATFRGRTGRRTGKSRERDMTEAHRSTPRAAVLRGVLFVALMAAFLAAPPARASEQQNIVDQARIAFDEVRRDENFTSFATYFARAKAVLIMPNLVKGGFILGGEGGRGVLLARTPETGAWSYPAFYLMGSASIGLQIGAQVSQVVFLIMTDGGLEKLLSGSVTLGVDANVAAGPVGAGIEAGSTPNIDVDFLSFARTKGAFIGVSFEGAVLKPDDAWTAAYYGKPLTAAAVVAEHRAGNAGAEALRQLLAAP